MTDDRDAYLTALRLLARRELSAAQVRERLARHGVAGDEIDRTLGRLREEGAIDDRRMARAFASTALRVKGRGQLRVLREIEAAGVDRETARAAVAEVFGEEDEAALVARALGKRLRGPIRDEAHLRRLYQYLTRLGFSPSAISTALKARRRGTTDEG